MKIFGKIEKLYSLIFQNSSYTATIQPNVASQAINTVISLPATAALASETLVGLATADSLTNKTLVTPTIASFVNANHDHSNVAGGGTVSHGSLSNLGVDTHTQYALLAGRAGGQTLIGGTAASNNLALSSTSDSTKGYIQIPSAELQIKDPTNGWFKFTIPASFGNGPLVRMPDAQGNGFTFATLALSETFANKTLTSPVLNGSLSGTASASGSQAGYLTSTDWTTFNSKEPAVTKGNLTDLGTDGITVTGGSGAVIGSGTSLSQHVADSTHNGYLSSTDWGAFNTKEPTVTKGNLTDVGTDGITVTGGTGSVIGSGTSISQHVADTSHNGYLSSTDWGTFNGKQAALGFTAVPNTRTVNSKALSADISLTASDVGADISGAASTAVSAHAGLPTTHGVSGNLVGTTDTQPLSNKTLGISTSYDSEAATISSNTITPTADKPIQRITSGSNLYMIAAPISGEIKTLINESSADIIISHDTGSTASNRIYTGTGSAFTLKNNSACDVVYDSTLSRWILSGGSGGGLVTDTQTASFTAVAGKHHLVLLSSADITATLPAGSTGAVIWFSTRGNSLTNYNLIIACAGAETLTYNDSALTSATLLPRCGWAQLSWTGTTWAVDDQAQFVSGTFAGDIAFTGKVNLMPIATPANPSSSNDVNIYVKGGKIIFQYNDGGTVRWKSLDLSGTGVTWVAATSAP